MPITAYGRNGYYQLAGGDATVSLIPLSDGPNCTWLHFRGKRGAANAMLRGPASEILALLDKLKAQVVAQMEGLNADVS